LKRSNLNCFGLNQFGSLKIFEKKKKKQLKKNKKKAEKVADGAKVQGCTA
jgi:hypothetical protein